MNSILNSLYFVPQFAKYFSSPLGGSKRGIAYLLSSFVSQYGRMQVNEDLLWRIREYFPQFRRGIMGSAYDFLLKLLEVLDEENSEYVGTVPLESKYDAANTWMSELERYRTTGCRELHEAFSLMIEETRQCSHCKKLSVKYFYQRTLSLDLITEKEKMNLKESRPKRQARTPSSLSIESCLRCYCATETDALDATHSCQHCRKDRVHITQKSFKHIGSVLVIYLQRYHSFYSDAQVSVPEVLDMSTYLPEAGRYRLSAAIRHEGSRESGHYTCFVRIASEWMFCNDTRVEIGNPAESYLNSSTLFIYLKAPY